MFRYIFSLALCALFVGTANAQTQISPNFSGLIFDKSTGNPIADAYVFLNQNNKTIRQTTTNRVGRFAFAALPAGTYTLRITHVGYTTAEQQITVAQGTSPQDMVITLEPLVAESQEVVVQAFRANAKTPITQTTLNQKTIESEYVGHDIPTLISGTPSINSYSDAGNGMGYSSFRIRGIDQTRINFTVNGVPVNDAESQGFFTNNFADLASSAEEIQVQRGVGTSNNGTAALGGSVNIVSRNLQEEAQFTLHTGYGSFNSTRNTIEYQTGRLANGKLAFYGRFSDLASDGYRNQSGTHNQTYFFSGGLFGKKSLLKFNMWGGYSQSQLANSAIDKATLENNRRFNPLTAAEKDKFIQNFYQLQYTYHFNSKLNFSASGYYVKGTAPYFDVRFNAYSFSKMNMPDTVFQGTDTVTSANFVNSYRLDQQFVGGFASLNYIDKKLQLSAGIHANSFTSDHYMQAKWASALPAGIEPNHTVYFNTGVKQEMSAFAKASYQVGEKLTLFADVMARRAAWKYTSKEQQYLFTQYNVEPMTWLFVNPKVGARYQTTQNSSIYLNAGMTSREPTRFDYLRDDLAWRDIKQDELKPEKVYDIELGTNVSNRQFWLNANVYYMLFENQIANTGFVNQFGASITQNTGSGYRAGIEIEGQWNITPRLAFTLATNLSDNRINNYKQFYYVSDEQGTPIGADPQGFNFNNVQSALSPQVISNQGLKYSPVHFLSINANTRYVGKQYIDNTATETLSLPSYFVADASLVFDISHFTGVGQQTLSFRVNNITNTLYTPSGAIGAWTNTMQKDAQGVNTVTTPAAYFPAATTNFFVTLMMRF